MLISKENHISCDFPGGSGPPIPLWIRTCFEVSAFSVSAWLENGCFGVIIKSFTPNLSLKIRDPSGTEKSQNCSSG